MWLYYVAATQASSTGDPSEPDENIPLAAGIHPAEYFQPANEEAASSDVQVIAVLDFEEDADQDFPQDRGNRLKCEMIDTYDMYRVLRNWKLIYSS